MSRQDAHVQSPDIPTAESLIDQIDAEVRLATARVTGSGWTTSGVLVALLPVLWALVNELRTRWHEPLTIAYNWGLLFLLLSLFFDALETFPQPSYRRFNSPDVRERLQWTHLFNFRVNTVDLIRYFILILILIRVDFGIEWYAVTAATTFYVLRLILGLLGKFLSWSPILVPFNRTLQYKFFTSYFLACAGLITGALFLQALINSFEAISASDLLITGLLASFFYLLRVLFVPVTTPYVMALEEVRHDLAVADIDVTTAKRRLASIKGGMTLVETVEDYTSLLRLLLGNMRDELREAIRALEPVPEYTDNTPVPPMPEDPASMEERWARHKAHLYNFRAYFKAFKKESRSRRFRLYNALVRIYRQSYFHRMTTQTKRGMEASFAALRSDHESCRKLGDEYARVRRDFTEKFAKTAKHKLKKVPLEITGTTFELPDSLRKTEDALLKKDINRS